MNMPASGGASGYRAAACLGVGLLSRLLVCRARAMVLVRGGRGIRFRVATGLMERGQRNVFLAGRRVSRTCSGC